MNHKIVWMAALCAGLLTGCGAARPIKYYQLTIPGGTASAAQSAIYPVTLLLGPMNSSELYREDHVVYSTGSERMGAYEYQRWAEPPTTMLQQVLLRALRASGRYKVVDLLRSNSHGDYVLYGRIYDFKEVDVPMLAARVTFEFEMRDSKTGSVVWTHYYSHDEPVATSKDVLMVIAALDHNAQMGISETQSSLDQYFSTHPGN